jgi:hypothetical protein
MLIGRRRAAVVPQQCNREAWARNAAAGVRLIGLMLGVTRPR